MTNTKQVGTKGRTRPWHRFWRVFRLLMIGVLFVVSTTLIVLFPVLPGRTQINFQEGDIAPEDIVALRDASYISQIETENARQQALAQVTEIFDSPDPRIARQQVLRARQVMAYVRVVRADLYASDTLKQEYLDQMTVLALSETEHDGLLAITESQFDQLEREVVSLIEETMSGTVQEGEVTDAAAQLELKVSAELPEVLIPLAVGITSELIAPNSALNMSLTEEARAEALSNVPEIVEEFREGEVVVRGGEPVDQLDLEALRELGFMEEQITWQVIVSALLGSLLAAVMLSVFIVVLRGPWLNKPGLLLMATILFLLFLLAGQIMIPGQGGIAYLFPAAALALAFTALYGVEFAALTILVLAGILGYLANRSLEITFFIAMSSLLAAGSLRRNPRLNNFFLSGIFASVGGIAIELIFRLPTQIESTRLAEIMGLSLLNGLLSIGIALVILFLAGNLTGIATSLRLLDLMRTDHPLQRRLQREALGTYQHTLSVSNLAEAAAEAIGADPLLTRVGTLYHDIGKMNNPGFFIENRGEGGVSPHQGLSPLASTRIIIAHVEDGVKIAGRHRLPPRIVDFITEHHGTMPVIFFLNKAREEAAAASVELDEREYFYTGPRPQSRETAVVMLCDASESATRANRPTSSDEIEAIVDRIFEQRMQYHQLDDSGLTLHEINVVRDSIIRTLKGMYHPRIQYPQMQNPSQAGDAKNEDAPAEEEEAPDADNTAKTTQ